MACRRARPDDELLAFWPVGDPHRRRHVCRPSLGLPGPVGGRGSCFSTAVGVASQVAIALVAPGATIHFTRPIRPGTPAWARLLAEAGVRPEIHRLGAALEAQRRHELAATA